ncbi:MAG TPA: hypothetical protein VKB69_02610, partial [Micromonosporaceae bacterium]|nr:hypothetical protein [Micromonosporaceae bacterium]
MTNTQLRALRGTVSAVAVFAAAAVLAGCTSPGAIPRTSLAGQPVAADQPSPVDANPAGNPTPATTPSPPPVHPSHPSSHPSSSSSGSHRPAPSPTVVVSAVDSSYTGLCPPPTDATEFKAVITVRSGPTTVTFRWTTSNGGDSDPSTQTITFPGNGHQSRTVYHNEHFYPPAPYPAHITDWVAVDLMTPVQTQSNHVGIAINCVPLTAAIKRTSDDYKGPCPPPAGATGFDLYINSTVDTNA